MALLTACTLLTGCSSSGGSTPDSQPVADQKQAVVGLGSAEQVAAYLEQQISTMSTKTVYTAATDPDHLLGKPDGYRSKVAFTDSRVQPGQVDGASASPVDLGGIIETFATSGDARSRAAHLQSTLKGLSAAEYHYYVGGSLVRVSRILTPDQVEDYQAAAESLG
ncbi:hypothetical protein V2S66_31775 [Streptomyces sp. V4-01]|uniref:Lipoprotein n=1 Tax=Actinacidiphila polyblastidii TaxID=3110430 RepID=A0ABU7PNA2_9ACTN|nr:hypothetical protein [Streptomyces sp. V4-01]